MYLKTWWFDQDIPHELSTISTRALKGYLLENEIILETLMRMM